MSLLKKWSDRRQIRTLASLWKQYRAAIDVELASTNDTSPVSEHRFLTIQSRIAKRLPVLGQVVGRRSLDQEAQAAARDMTELMNRMNTLATAGALPEAVREEALREWHVLYLFLQKLEGTMTGSTTDGVVLVNGSATTAAQAPAYGLATSPATKRGVSVVGIVNWALVVLVLALLTAVVLGVGGEDVARLTGATSSRPVDSVVESEMIDGAAPAQAPTGETEVPAPAAPRLSQRVSDGIRHAPQTLARLGLELRQRSRDVLPRLVQPVVNRHGVASALIFGGAMLLGSLLLFRLRTR